MAAKRGRPAKQGDRYKCGKLKPAETSKQPISPALWQRIKTNGQKIGLDPRLGTELGRLALHDELTSAEVSAGFRIAEIYEAFEFFYGRTRSAAGSSFFRQFVADLEKPIEVGRSGPMTTSTSIGRSGSARRAKISTCFSITCPGPNETLSSKSASQADRSTRHRSRS
jgi:hypothetical protein